MKPPASVSVLREKLQQTKRLFGSLDWKPVNQTTRVGTSVEVEGAIAQGLLFRMTAVRELPDEKVTIVLLTEIQRKPRPFARIDWRGLEHFNGWSICGPHRHVDAGRTHFHDPGLHEHLSISELYAENVDLPVALPITPEPSSFRELLERSANLMHIENLTDIQTPPWSPRTSLF